MHWAGYQLVLLKKQKHVLLNSCVQLTHQKKITELSSVSDV